MTLNHRIRKYAISEFVFHLPVVLISKVKFLSNLYSHCHGHWVSGYDDYKGNCGQITLAFLINHRYANYDLFCIIFPWLLRFLTFSALLLNRYQRITRDDQLKRRVIICDLITITIKLSNHANACGWGLFKPKSRHAFKFNPSRFELMLFILFATKTDIIIMGRSSGDKPGSAL